MFRFVKQLPDAIGILLRRSKVHHGRLGNTMPENIVDSTQSLFPTVEMSEFYLRRYASHYGSKHFVTIAKRKYQVEVRAMLLPKSGKLYGGESDCRRNAVGCI